MASQLNVRHGARIVVLLVAAFVLLWASVDARAQGKSNAPSQQTGTTTGNSSWDQAIAALKAQVDQQAAVIAQLQAALAAETSARENADTALQAGANNEAAARAGADTTLQSSINNETAARQAAYATWQSAMSAEAAARQQGDAASLAAAKQYADSVGGGTSELAAAKQYADSVVATEAAARQATDGT